jgi:LacI family transcriptional regulator
MSLKEIAIMTKLSIATVSHALNNTRSVSSKNKEIILEAAKKIGYKPNMAAKALKTNKSKTIALIIPRVAPGRSTNYFYMDIIAGANACIDEKRYSLIIGTYPELHKDHSPISIRILENKWVDGVLVVPNSMERSNIKEIENINVPIVLIDRKLKESSFDFVVSNNESGAYKAIDLMYKKGRRKIALVATMLRTSASYERYIGYKKYLYDFGMEEDKNLIILNEDQSIESGMRSAEQIVKLGADGVLVIDNILSMGIFRYFKKHGICMPSDISLIGYDNYDWMEDLNPSLTAVAQKPYEMGYKAANILIDRLNNANSSNEQISIILDSEVVCRQSH